MDSDLKHNFGWLPDHADQRDYQASRVLASPTTLPSKVDLRSEMPPIYDQGALGSCTANAIAAVLDHCRYTKKEQFITPSRLFIYWNERDMEGTVNSDAGAAIRDGIKSVRNLGDCPESEWPYRIDKFVNKPAPRCYTNALKYRALSYARVAHTRLNNLKVALATNYPIVFGFTVYESFEAPSVATTGIMPLPKRSESVLGGHAVVAVGYDDDTQQLICRNSWGVWGDQGYFYMPYKYATSRQCSDFWIIKTVL